MSGKKKLLQFAELDTFSNVVQHDKTRKGNWESFFQKPQDLTLELACGKGEYTTALASMYPNKNVLGLDIKGNRLWHGAKRAMENELGNAGFLRCYIHEIQDYFEKDEVKDIFIIFPDPFLRKSKSKKRLTSPAFLQRFRHIATNDCKVKLKTDSPELYEFTLEVINEEGLHIHRNYTNIYEQCPEDELLCGVQTFYEKMHLLDNRIIKYVEFNLFPDKA